LIAREKYVTESREKYKKFNSTPYKTPYKVKLPLDQIESNNILSGVKEPSPFQSVTHRDRKLLEFYNSKVLAERNGGLKFNLAREINNEL
jgi:hypothetical protein